MTDVREEAWWVINAEFLERIADKAADSIKNLHPDPDNKYSWDDGDYDREAWFTAIQEAKDKYAVDFRGVPDAELCDDRYRALVMKKFIEKGYG